MRRRVKHFEADTVKQAVKQFLKTESTLAETRTPNLLIKSQLLCQLSYQGMLRYNRD